MKECENFKGRKRAICDGSADLPLNRINKYRRSWGLDDLNSNGVVKSADNTKQVKAVAGCRSCKKNKKPVITFDQALENYKGEASEPEVEIRQNICDGCPLLQDDMCMACGCTVSKKIKNKTEQCPVGKWLPEIKERRKIEEPIRNLMFYILPVSGNDMWKWNIEQIAERIDLFNGKIIVSISSIDNQTKIRRRGGKLIKTDDADLVLSELEKNGINVDKFFYYKNTEKLGEVIAFEKAMSFLQSDNPNELTFSCHAKGVTHGDDWKTKKWAELMYHACLSDWDTIHNALELYSMAGAFRRFGYFATPGNNKWHYSGTFYWFRHDDVFSRNWKKIDQKFFGTESWPGLMFESHECACIFNDDAGNLYTKSEAEKSQALFEEWKMGRRKDNG